jgi:hypothetical protein
LGLQFDEAGKVTIINVQDKGLLGIVSDAAENGSFSMLEDLSIASP